MATNTHTHAHTQRERGGKQISTKGRRLEQMSLPIHHDADYSVRQISFPSWFSASPFPHWLWLDYASCVTVEGTGWRNSHKQRGDFIFTSVLWRDWMFLLNVALLLDFYELISWVTSWLNERNPVKNLEIFHLQANREKSSKSWHRLDPRKR